MSSKSTLTVLESQARTATPTDASLTISDNGQFTDTITDIHLVIDVTALALTPSVQPFLEGFDSLSSKWYSLVDSIAAVTATGTTTIKYGINTPVLANISNQGFIPIAFRLRMVHADTDSITYSVGMNYLQD
jgi:hypothetical protein